MTAKGGWTLSRQSWISASIILVAAAAISKGLGFGREILIANYFGATGSVDAFAVAYSVPLFVAGGIGFTLSTAIVPGYHRIRASKGPQRAAQFLCSAGLSSVIFSVILLAPLWIAPLSVMKLVAPALPDATLRLAADLMGWLSLYVLVSNGVYVLTAVFHALNHFKIPAYSDIAFNLATIVILVGYALPLGIYSLVLGNLVGSLLCLAILAGTLLKVVPGRPTVHISGDDMRGLLPLTLPILGYYVCSQIGGLVANYFAATLSEGSVAALNYARTTTVAVVTLVTMNVSRGIFPTLSMLSSNQRSAEGRAIVIALGKLLIFLFIPLSIMLMLRARELLSVLYVRGVFDAAALASTATVFVFLAATLLVAALEPVLIRTSYALADMRTPLMASLAGAVVLAALLYTMTPRQGIGGIGLAMSVALVVQVGIQTVVISGRLGGTVVTELASMMVRSLLCGMVAIPALVVVPLRGGLGLVAELVLYVACYYGLARILVREELKAFLTAVGWNDRP